MLKICEKTGLDEEKLKETKLINNEDLEEFDFSRVIVRKPWGHEYLLYNGDGVAAWVLHIKKDDKTSMHCHVDKTTILIVLSGKVTCFGLNDSFNLLEGDGLVIEKKRFHSTMAVSDKGAIVLEVENPAKKTDLVRLKDAYGRALKGYESQNDMCFDLSMDERAFLREKEIDVNKKIGHMNICIKMFNDNFSFKNHLKNNRNSINLILNGEIQDKKNSKIYKKGDIFEVKNSEETDNISIDNPIKIFQITKDISDFD